MGKYFVKLTLLKHPVFLYNIPSIIDALKYTFKKAKEVLAIILKLYVIVTPKHYVPANQKDHSYQKKKKRSLEHN